MKQYCELIAVAGDVSSEVGLGEVVVMVTLPILSRYIIELGVVEGAASNRLVE